MLRHVLTSALLLGTIACSDRNMPTSPTRPSELTSSVGAITPEPDDAGSMMTDTRLNAAFAPTRVPAAATVITTNERIALGVFGDIPCVPETVSGGGTIHMLAHTTTNPDGGFHVVSHFNPQGVIVIGNVTGNVYRGTGVTRETFNIHVGEQLTRVNNFRLIGPGPGNNLIVHENLHITINANGELTATVDNVTFECK